MDDKTDNRKFRAKCNTSFEVAVKTFHNAQNNEGAILFNRPDHNTHIRKK